MADRPLPPFLRDAAEAPPAPVFGTPIEAPARQLPPELEEGRDEGFIYVDELTPLQLRLVLREHVLMLFLGGVLATIGFVLPSSPWGWMLPKVLLFGAGMLLGGTRLMQVNGIYAELQRRSGGEGPERAPAEPPRVTPTAPRLPAPNLNDRGPLRIVRDGDGQ